MVNCAAVNGNDAQGVVAAHRQRSLLTRRYETLHPKLEDDTSADNRPHDRSRVMPLAKLCRRWALLAAISSLASPSIHAADLSDADAAKVVTSGLQIGDSLWEADVAKSPTFVNDVACSMVDIHCADSNCHCADSDCACRRASTIWVSGEYLLWWTDGVRLPPLISASPPGTPQSEAAILGGPNTEILFGDVSVNNDARHGFRLKAGYWVDGDSALEGSFFFLGSDSEHLTAGSADSSQIVGRPFIDAQTGEGLSLLTSFPGIVSGFTTASASSDGLLGADVGWRRAIYRAGRSRLDWTVGYRFLHYADDVVMSQSLAPVTQAYELDLRDSFSAGNQFHGGYLGFLATRNRGPWTLEAQARLDIGGVLRKVHIDGETTFTVPGVGSATAPGGFLALSSNSGTYHSASAIVVPELEIRSKYQVERNLQFFVGYTFIYWSQVARAGDQIDLTINRDLVPLSMVDPPTGPLRPEPQ
jgi:Putative beta barrel porin-7 (BBP7)